MHTDSLLRATTFLMRASLFNGRDAFLQAAAELTGRGPAGLLVLEVASGARGQAFSE